MREQVLEWIDEVLEGAVEAHTDSQFPEEWDLDEMFAGPALDLPGQLRAPPTSARAPRSSARS